MLVGALENLITNPKILKSGIARCVSAELMDPNRKRPKPSGIRDLAPNQSINAVKGDRGAKRRVAFRNNVSKHPRPESNHIPLLQRGRYAQPEKDSPKGWLFRCAKDLPQRAKRARINTSHTQNRNGEVRQRRANGS